LEQKEKLGIYDAYECPDVVQLERISFDAQRGTCTRDVINSTDIVGLVNRRCLANWVAK
jgi:hypothetical protein